MRVFVYSPLDQISEIPDSVDFPNFALRVRIPSLAPIHLSVPFYDAWCVNLRELVVTVLLSIQLYIQNQLSDGRLR